MDVRVRGRLSAGLLPSPSITVEDGHILDTLGVDVASARRIRCWFRLLPLLRGELRPGRIELTQPQLSLDRDAEGRLNAARLERAVALLGALSGTSFKLSDGSLRYTDRRSGEEIELTDCDLDVSRLRLEGGTRQPPKILALNSRFTCGEIRTRRLVATALKVSVVGRDGVFQFEPVTMAIFGGQATASLRADVSGAIPSCEVRCSLPRFRIEQFLLLLSPNKGAEGTMDFATTLSMHGSSWSQMIQSAAGEISLRGEHLTLVGTDLDLALSRFESSQNFSLVDVGGVLLAGPLGLAVTKGYNFVNLFRGTGGNSRIGNFVSEWKVEHGVAQAKDVALATTKNRIALQGGLDLANDRFADVTVAVINAEGCATVRQEIRGTLGRPIVAKPQMFGSITGPAVNLYKLTRGVFPQGPCDVFYAGSVAPPEAAR
jgi:AsmA protein